MYNPMETKHKSSAKTSQSKPAKNEDARYPREAESGSANEGADTSFSEQNDVTPPNKKEFPSVGAAKTDFASRKQGRTTGRMIGHEPGTEGI
jgi:hypothetical protein